MISSNSSSFLSLSLVKHENIKSGQVWRPGRPRHHLHLCVFSPVSRTAMSSRSSAAVWAHHEGQSDLLLESSFYNIYQTGRYPPYYGNLYNYQQYQVSQPTLVRVLRDTETVSLLTTAVFLIGDRLPPEIRAEMIHAAHYDIINLL